MNKNNFKAKNSIAYSYFMMNQIIFNNMNIYKPGQVNVGENGQRKHLDMAIASGMITMGWTFVSYVWIFATWLQLFVFIPALFSVLGIIQYKNKFNIIFGLTQKHNIDDAPEPHNVLDSILIDKDREKAVFLLLLSVLLALIYSVVIISIF